MASFFNKRIVKLFAIISAVLFAIAGFLFTLNNAYAVTDTYTSSGTWTAPAGVTSVTAEVWGGGGAGGGQNQNSNGGGGGGGGAYSVKNTITVIPGNNYTIAVGAGGAGVASSCGGNGGDSWFVNTATVLAKGGTGGCPSTGTPPQGGLGGLSASGVGDTKFSGGQGEAGRNHSNGIGGYGGSSAGTAANGWSGPQTYNTYIYPTANTPTGAGHGGNGGTAGNNGSLPVSGYGGGGGGSGEGTAMVGGNGYGGKIVLTYTPNTAPTLSISQPDGSGDTVTVGDLYNVTYTLSDAEQTVTSAFYYDTDNFGLNGTAITGACETAPEGTNATCSWNTAGVTPGSYYVYGLTSDGIAGQVSAYSPGVITINAVPASGTVSANPSTCTISSGGSTCTVPFTWSISNATSPNLYNLTSTTTYSTLASGTGVSYPITNGVNTVQVRDGTTVLNSTTATGSCISGTSWNGSTCAETPAVPTVTTPTATSISTSSATLGANVTSLGVPATISARGTCWGTSPSPTTNCLAASGTTTGVFTHARTGMSPNTFYYYRGYATNSTGTGYSTDGTFTTTATASGTVSANPSTCTISSGGSTCTVPFTWSISNATSPNLYNLTSTTTYSTLASGTGVSYPITNGVNTVQVRDGTTVLNSTTATGSCISGTSWNGTLCSAITYTIFASSGSNGTVSPTGTTTVAQGGSQAYSITPNSGYDVETLLVDEGSVTATTTYTFTNVTANHTISATFYLLPITHTITSSAGSHGTISPLGAIAVADGGSQAFNITPESGYYFATLVVDSESIATTTPYTFTNVTADHTISVTFEQIPPTPGSHTIIANQNPNGTVSPAGSTVVADGGSQTYTITPNSGYDVGSIIIDSNLLSGTSTSYTFTSVIADHTIEATFTALPGTAPVSTVRRLASITFIGKAFPDGKISVVQKGIAGEIETTQQGTTDGNGFFNFRFGDLASGAHSFGLLIKDPDGRTSQTKFFVVDVIRGDEVYKDIIAPPTIDILNGQVSRGGNLKVFGYASPGHTIRVYINDILVKEALAGRGGVYSFDIPTGALEFGQNKIRAKQINLDGGKESDFGAERTFLVSKLTVVKADFSGDGKIDIKDWSIFLARWGSKSSIGRSGIDLNSDGKVDIADFSIFIKTIRKK